jgi:hypothetical protein
MRWWRRPPCRHDNLRGIYGDEINRTPGYARSQCRDCGVIFPGYPPTRDKEKSGPCPYCYGTGTQPPMPENTASLPKEES